MKRRDWEYEKAIARVIAFGLMILAGAAIGIALGCWAIT